MARVEFECLGSDGKPKKIVRYDLSGKWREGKIIDPEEIKRKSRLLEKGFSNLTEEEKGEWIKYFNN